jgi:hypothetical protein
VSDDLNEEKRQRILAGMSEWSVDECPACGEPLGRDYRLPDHLEDGCPELGE